MAETVLVVEDDPANAVLIETILSRFGGFAVVASDDGDEVLRLAAGAGLAAVLMDVSLADTRVTGNKVDGIELTRRIRSLPGCAHLPIILYSKLPGQEDGNVTFVVEEGAGVWAPTPQLVVRALTRWISRPHEKARVVQTCERLARPDAARLIARSIAGLLGKKPREVGRNDIPTYSTG